MFWSIVLYILGITAGILILLTLVLLFTPLTFSSEFSYVPSNKNITISATWVNSAILKIFYSLGEGMVTIRVFGFYSIKRKSEPDIIPGEEPEKPEKPEVSSVEEISEPQMTEIPSEPHIEEKKEDATPVETVPVDKKRDKRDNLLKRLKKNIAVYFLLNATWRSKIIRWFLRFSKKVLQLISFKRFTMNIEAGIEEPVILGEVYGAIEALRYGLALNNSPFDICLTPHFMENRFECSGRIGFNTSFFRILLPLIIAIGTFPYFSTLLLWRKYRKTYSKKLAEV